MRDPEDVVRFTIGRFEVHPGSPNTVPGRVHFTIDFRHPDSSALRARGDRIAEVAAAHARPCAGEGGQISDLAPTIFAPAMIESLRGRAAHLRHPPIGM